MANPEHLELARRGSAAINSWRRINPSVRLDLSEADLRGADLYMADLSKSNLQMANLSYASLGGAKLYKANLSHANLIGANLHLADLSKANLDESNLHLANIRGTELAGKPITFLTTIVYFRPLKGCLATVVVMMVAVFILPAILISIPTAKKRQPEVNRKCE